MEKTCRMLADTFRKDMEPVPVSVNFSQLHIHTPNFVQRLDQTVKKYGVPASLVEIEFTETAFINDIQPLYHLIEELHAYGYEVAMDDFGAGFSSLNHLMNMPVDVLKLDRDFLKLTSENKNRAMCIIRSLAQMAKALGIRVVAEGVEDLQCLEVLRQCGCGIGQGYYFSKPVPEEVYCSFLPMALAAV